MGGDKFEKVSKNGRFFSTNLKKCRKWKAFFTTESVEIGRLFYDKKFLGGGQCNKKLLRKEDRMNKKRQGEAP